MGGKKKITMALFGRNNEEDEELDEELEAEKKENRKLTKKLKDLNPKNKKKRKEPVKPWGKKERMIVLVALIATAFVSLMLMITATGGVNFHASFPKLSFPSLNMFGEETIVLEKK